MARRVAADPRLLAIVLAAAYVPASAIRAAAAGDGGRFRAIVLVDVIPPDRAAGLALLTRYVDYAKHDPNIRSVTLTQQENIANHFILEEAFVGRIGYDRFVAEPRVRAFRSALFAHLGSPWDERRGTTPAPSGSPGSIHGEGE